MTAEHFECPVADDGKHITASSSAYYNHLGQDIGTPPNWTREQRPFASVAYCKSCKQQIFTVNLDYPHDIRWDNRPKSYPGAKGGWTRFTGMEQITYRIVEEAFP